MWSPKVNYIFSYAKSEDLIWLRGSTLSHHEQLKYVRSTRHRLYEAQSDVCKFGSSYSMIVLDLILYDCISQKILLA
jgi:hypothetical protein